MNQSLFFLAECDVEIFCPPLADGKLSIAGTTKTVSIVVTGQENGGNIVFKGSKKLNMTDYDMEPPVTANKMAGDRFRFIGNKKFCMSDFGVMPPTAMMGVVKVQDEIKIKLDLDVSIQ